MNKRKLFVEPSEVLGGEVLRQRSIAMTRHLMDAKEALQKTKPKKTDYTGRKNPRDLFEHDLAEYNEALAGISTFEVYVKSYVVAATGKDDR